MLEMLEGLKNYQQQSKIKVMYDIVEVFKDDADGMDYIISSFYDNFKIK